LIYDAGRDVGLARRGDEMWIGTAGEDCGGGAAKEIEEE